MNTVDAEPANEPAKAFGDLVFLSEMALRREARNEFWKGNDMWIRAHFLLLRALAPFRGEFHQ